MKYSIMVPVEHCSGYQFWEIEAKSIEEAKIKFVDGGGDFLDEEIEVTSLDYDNMEVEEIEDE